jgi:hypothetical protein
MNFPYRIELKMFSSSLLGKNGPFYHNIVQHQAFWEHSYGLLWFLLELFLWLGVVLMNSLALDYVLRCHLIVIEIDAFICQHLGFSFCYVNNI